MPSSGLGHTGAKRSRFAEEGGAGEGLTPRPAIRPRWEAGSPAPSTYRIFSPRPGVAQLDSLPSYQFSKLRPRRSSAASDSSRGGGAAAGGGGGGRQLPAQPQHRRKLVAAPSRLAGGCCWILVLNGSHMLRTRPRSERCDSGLDAGTPVHGLRARLLPGSLLQPAGSLSEFDQLLSGDVLLVWWLQDSPSSAGMGYSTEVADDISTCLPPCPLLQRALLLQPLPHVPPLPCRAPPAQRSCCQPPLQLPRCQQAPSRQPSPRLPAPAGAGGAGSPQAAGEGWLRLLRRQRLRLGAPQGLHQLQPRLLLQLWVLPLRHLPPSLQHQPPASLWQENAPPARRPSQTLPPQPASRQHQPPQR